MKLAGLLLLSLLTAAQQPSAGKVSASLGRLFGKQLRVDSLSLENRAVLRIRRADSLLGFAEVRNVKGKDQPITFLVGINPDATLRDIDILVYREPYGGEVAYESWRKQFRGKSANDRLEVDRDIRGISGATISVHAVTLGIRTALADFARWLKQGLLR